MAGSRKTSCQRCRVLKLRCDRTLPICERCTQAGRECNYEADNELRIRDQTPAAAERAVRKWRTKTRPRRPRERNLDHAEEQQGPEYGIALPIENLAHQRFLYDFTGLGLSAFRANLKAFVEVCGPGTAEETGPVLAVSAVALANFHKRQNDERAAKLAWRSYGKALTKLRDHIAFDRGSVVNTRPNSFYARAVPCMSCTLPNSLSAPRTRA